MEVLDPTDPSSTGDHNPLCLNDNSHKGNILLNTFILM